MASPAGNGDNVESSQSEASENVEAVQSTDAPLGGAICIVNSSLYQS
jgi:hypothetical protein